MVIDLAEKVVECKSLDCPPFTINFRRTLNHILVMDEPRAKTRVHLADTYRQVIKDIENLERFYEAKVLAISSRNIFDPAVFKVCFGTGNLPVGPNGTLIHPRGPDGSRLDGESDSSDDSCDSIRSTPQAAIPKSKAKDNMKSRWGPPTSVHGNDDYPSSVLNKDGYL